MKKKIGTGIFCWRGVERQTNRYGEFYLGLESYNHEKTKEIVFSFEAIREFEGKRVRLIAVVTENRPSGHAGDRVLNLFPNPAKEGTEVEIGIGTFKFRAGDESFFSLIPDQDRDEMWIDPRRFYELHDQTITLFGEIATDPAHPVYVPVDSSTEVCVDNGDGTFQLKTKRSDKKHFQVEGQEPIIRSLGEGMFCVKAPPNLVSAAGTKRKLL